jgi:hypothetical protein
MGQLEPINHVWRETKAVNDDRSTGKTRRENKNEMGGYGTWQVLNHHERYLSFTAARPITRYLPNGGQALTVQGDSLQLRFQFIPLGNVTGVSAAGDGIGTEANIAEIFRSISAEWSELDDNS